MRRRNAAILLAAVACAWLCGFSLSTLIQRGEEMGKILGALFPADLGYLPKVLPPLLATLRMSLLGTFLGALAALPLAGLCSRRASGHPRMAAVLRGLIHLLRAIPVLVVALLCSFVPSEEKNLAGLTWQTLDGKEEK